MTGVSDDELYRQYETVNLYRRGAGAKVELNRPDRLNAWNAQFAADLNDAIREVTADPGVRAVLITGAGRAFSSGADLKESTESAGTAQSGDGPPDVYTVLTERYHPLITGIRHMPKPVVAAVNGPAAGIGLSLALACDLVVAAESAFFQLAFVNIGLVPDGGSSLLVPSRVGFARAAELAMLGERLDRLAGGATRSYAGTKRQLNRWLYEQMNDQLEFEAQIQREMSGSADFAEGVRAFAEKRPARFTGA